MYRVAAALLTALSVLTVATGEAQQKLNRRIAIAPDASIRIYNLAGTTRVTGWDRDSIAVTGISPAGTTFFMGGSGRVAKLGLELDEKLPPGATAASGHLEVQVPRGARVWVRAAEAAIEVSGMTGEVDLSSVGGAIRISGDLRLITAESIEGDLELDGSTPLVRVKTGGGKIVLRRSAGDLTASTVSGPILLSDARVSSARLETVSGSVSYAGTLDRRGSLYIQTHSGDVELSLPTGLGVEFDLESRGPLVQVALPAKTPKPIRGKTVFFANAGGGAQVVVRTFKGQIQVFGQ